MKIILDDEAREWLESIYNKWKAEGYKNSVKNQFPDWANSPWQREDRRESITYANCSLTLAAILRQAEINEPEDGEKLKDVK